MLKRFPVLALLCAWPVFAQQSSQEEEYYFLPPNNLHTEDPLKVGFVDNFLESDYSVWCLPGQTPGQPGQTPCQPKPPVPPPQPPDQKPCKPGQNPCPPPPQPPVPPPPKPPVPPPQPPDQKPCKPGQNPCPPDQKPCSGSECDFYSLINRIEQVYQPIFSANGYKLVVNKDWYNSTVNLKTRRVFNTIVVDVYGGIARRREVTPDGLSLAVCHEFGRYLGGFAKNRFGQAVAGQADYFATTSCGRELWRNDVQYNASFRYAAPDYVRRLCEEVYTDQNSQNLCARQMVASYSVATLMAVLDGHYISYDIHDLNEVPATTDCHGTSQCRMDTLISGAICPVYWNPSVISKSEQEAVNQSCTEYAGYTLGYRPRCWFKPTLPSCNGSGC